MNPESIDNFLSLYLRSLYEESREVKAGPRFGLDRIIHQLAISNGDTSIRLPYFRESGDVLPKPKKEAEHGVDMSFVSRDRKTLTVFVLKDEPLTHKNFIAANFDKDLRLAVSPNLKDPALSGINLVRIILAYNKDEDEEGVEQYDRCVESYPTRLKRGIRREFDRWNLTRITDLVKERLLSPSLLPDSFFRRFSYICAQYGDFDATSAHWNELLIPDWREFLADVLKRPVKETHIRLVSIALIVLRQHAKIDAKGNPTRGAILGWIEIVEWAMLSLWRAAADAPKKLERKIKEIVLQFWVTFYLDELLGFYRKNAISLTAMHALEIPGGVIEDAGGSFRSHWHLGRLGLLSMALSEFLMGQGEDDRKSAISMLYEIHKWLVGLLNACPSCFRPMLDIQHIEQYLVWRSLANLNRWNDVEGWLTELAERIYVRYLGVCEIPGIDHRNSWELLMESLAGNDPKAGVPVDSSYLILMLMELSLALPNGRGDALIRSLYSKFVENAENSANRPEDSAGPVNLISWSPPEDWSTRILAANPDGGYGVTVSLDLEDPAASLRDFVSKSMQAEAGRAVPSCPPSVLVLACLRHSIPLPPTLWRQLVFAPRKVGEKNDS